MNELDLELYQLFINPPLMMPACPVKRSILALGFFTHTKKGESIASTLVPSTDMMIINVTTYGLVIKNSMHMFGAFMFFNYSMSDIDKF